MNCIPSSILYKTYTILKPRTSSGLKKSGGCKLFHNCLFPCKTSFFLNIMHTMHLRRRKAGACELWYIFNISLQSTKFLKVESIVLQAAFTLNYNYKMVTAPLIRKIEANTAQPPTTSGDGATGDDKEKTNAPAAPIENIITLSFPVVVRLGEINATLCWVWRWLDW